MLETDQASTHPCTRIQGYLFASDIKMYTRICLGDVYSYSELTNRHDIAVSHV